MNDYLKKNIAIREYVTPHQTIKSVFDRYPCLKDFTMDNRFNSLSTNKINDFFGEEVIGKHAWSNAESYNYLLTLFEDNYPELFL